MRFGPARRGIAAAAVTVAAIAAVTASTTTAHAAPLAAVTQVTNQPVNGNGGTWADGSFTRTLTVTADITAADCSALAGYTAAADTCYTATVTDKGSFAAVAGALTPNQATAGAKITGAARGTVAGTASYLLYAPTTDLPATANVEVTQDDAGTAPAGDHAVADWPAQAFATPASVFVAYANGGNGWSWTYKTACETWTDSAANGAGNLAGDGNITGKACPPPHLLGGHVITVGNNSAVIGWTDGPGVKYVLAKTFGYGFTVNGDPHIGFTGISTGYWNGLAAGHTYDIELIPAGADRKPLPHALAGWVTVVTTR